MSKHNDIRRTNAVIGMPVKLLCAAAFILQSSLFTSCSREDDLITAVEEYDPANAYGDYDETHWRRLHAGQRRASIGDLYRSYGAASA